MIGLLALTSIPTVTGVALASSEQRKANQRKEDARRMVKFNIEVECDGDTDDDRELNGMTVVVRDEKVSNINSKQSKNLAVKRKVPFLHNGSKPKSQFGLTFPVAGLCRR